MRSFAACIPVKRTTLLTIIFLSIWVVSRSNPTADSIQPVIPTRIEVFTESQWLDGAEPDGLDTTFRDLNAPDPVVRNGDQHLGLIGSPSRPLWNLSLGSVFSWTGLTALDSWLLRPGQVQHYRTNKRLTRLNYHMASFREQSIEAFHTQNILRNWNAGIRFNRFNVKDFLPRSDTYFNRFLFFTDFETKDKRYRLFASTVWNTFKNQLNGGITYDTVFIGQGVSNRDLRGLPVNLTAAGNRTREKSFHLGQHVRLDNGSDTSRLKIRLSLDSRYTAGSSTYFDDETDSTGLYDFYYDGLTSYDSVGFQEIRNKAGLMFAWKGATMEVRLTPFTSHQFFNYAQDTSINRTNLSAGGRLEFLWNRFHATVQNESVVSGEDEGNYSALASAGIHAGEWHFSGEILAGRSAVPLLYQGYHSNHLRWNNDFDTFTSLRTGISVNNGSLRLSFRAEIERINGFLYMGSDANPVRNNSRLEIRRAAASKDFRWKNWHLENQIRFQQVSDESVLHLPELGLFHSFYWEKDLLKKAFILTAGLRFRYTASYLGDAFMPASGFFYLQDSVTTAGQPLFDFFTDMRIKGATVFMAVENILQDVVSTPYFMTPSYPQAGMTFRFGVRWFFLDQ